jgi:4-amino-4-deoxy-L-arabinose transferase-like glycosyltransferase
MAAIGRIFLVRLTWTASIVAGVALGLALMSKGPVALLQSLAPAVVFVLLFRRRLRILPILVGLVIMLIVGGAWYAWVAIEVPTVWERWRIELTRASPVEKTGNPLGYFSLFAFMMPWSVVLIHGIIWTAVEAIDIARGRLDRAGREGWVLALLLLFVPIVVMSFFPDRKDRYLLPLLTPASIIAARGLSAMLDANDKRRVPPIVQWLILLVIAIGLPLFGVYGIKRTDGTPWWTLQFAVLSSAVLVVVIGIASAAARKWPLALVGASVAVMLLIQPIFYRGYRFAREGRAELRPLAELLRREFPDVEPFYVRPLGHRRVPSDFSIYLNRIAPWVADPSHIKPASVPQAYVIVQRPNEPEPEPAPGWYYLAKVKKDADWYHTFVRLPSNDTTNEAATQNAQ